MGEVENRPDPSALAESLRAFGYSLTDAVCDVVDNSLSARASKIDIVTVWDGASSWIAVIDDGQGMNGDELHSAMRLGSRSPVEARAEGDLGRFGLGMKTASFSQARRLLVGSMRDGWGLAQAVWDLDRIAQTGQWTMGTEFPEDTRVWATDLLTDHGTVVRWEVLDRLIADPEDPSAEAAFYDSVAELEEALGTVYGDWLSGRGRVRIRLNGNDVRGWDPFLSDHAGSQQLPTEVLPSADGRSVSVSAYVLPHHSRLSPDEHRAAAGPGGWNAQQGFYVYRNRRLLVSGGWLSLGYRAEDHYKLARIRIDIDNGDDHAWRIDVRKKQARVPDGLRGDLKRIARLTRGRASDVYRHRGTVIADRNTRDRTYVWQQKGLRGQTVFSINRRHPLVEHLATISGERRQVHDLLRLIEATLPRVDVSIAQAEAAENEAIVDPWAAYTAKDLMDIARTYLTALITSGMSQDDAMARMTGLEPCSSHPELLGLLKEELSDE